MTKVYHVFNLADGKSYEVRDAWKISIGRAWVVCSPRDRRQPITTDPDSKPGLDAVRARRSFVSYS